MSGAERVIDGLIAPKESRKTVHLADRVKAVFAPGEEFVAVSLVAGVPDYLVIRGVENVVQSEGELGRAQGGAQVASASRNDLQNSVPNFPGELRQLIGPKLTKVSRFLDLVE